MAGKWPEEGRVLGCGHGVRSRVVAMLAKMRKPALVVSSIVRASPSIPVLDLGP